MIWPTINQFYKIAFMYQAYILMIKVWNVKSNQTTSMINCHSYDDTAIPCKQTLVCHVAVESILYFSYTSVLLHCINTVMIGVVCRPCRLINSFFYHGSSHVLFVVKIIKLPLSALLWCMQIHVQNGLKQWAQQSMLISCIQSVCLLSSLFHCARSS